MEMLTDVIVLLLVAMAVIGVIKSIRKQKKSGSCGGCCGSCSGCSGCGSVHYDTAPKAHTACADGSVNRRKYDANDIFTCR